MIGLKSGTVKLVQHQEEWHENAENVIRVLKQLLGDTALDIQHVGSTAICSIHAKPIIDIAVAVGEQFDDPQFPVYQKTHIVLFVFCVIDGKSSFIKGPSQIPVMVQVTDPHDEMGGIKIGGKGIV